MEPQTPPLRESRLTPLLTRLVRPGGARLLATLGIVVTTIGLYVPVAGREVLIADGLLHAGEVWTVGDGVHALLRSLLVPLSAGPLPLLPQLGFEAVYAVLTLGGLALLPLLWRSLSPKGTTLARGTYAVWLVLLTMLAVACFPVWHAFMTQPPLGTSDADIMLAGSHLLPGAAVFPLGGLLSSAAFVLLLREPPAAAPTGAPRTAWQCTAALVLTAGIVVWGIGFYLMPQAVTAACPPVVFSVTQFAHGACAGLDSDQMRTAASYAGLNPIGRLLFALGNNFELLVALGCITALGGWTRKLSVYTLAWLAVWPLLALGVAVVALQGVDVIAQQGYKLTAATGGGWRIASGMIVTFTGIALVALGQFGLWYGWVRERTRRSAAAIQK